MSQEEFARHFGVSKRTVQDWEHQTHPFRAVASLSCRHRPRAGSGASGALRFRAGSMRVGRMIDALGDLIEYNKGVLRGEI